MFDYRTSLAQLPPEWSVRRIDEIGSVVSGGTPSRDVPAYWNGRVAWVTPGELTRFNSKNIWATNERISEAGVTNSGATVLPPGSLLVTTRATLGASAINETPIATNQGFKSIVFRNGYLSDYYYHWTHKLKAELERRASGTTFPEISGSEFKSIKVPVPPVGEQSWISRILDTLDVQIERTQALIAKLEQVKQGLLHDLLTRGVDENGELRPSAEEAPELYKASPLGLIPREWSANQLSSFLANPPRNGYSPKEAGHFSGRYMLGLGCLTKSGFTPCQLKNAPAYDAALESAKLRDGDLLMSRANTRELVGLVGIYRDVGHPCTYPDLMMKLTPNGMSSSEFLEIMLQSKLVRRQVQSSASGTSGSMVKISGATVQRLLVAIPAPQEQAQITKIVGKCKAQLADEVQTVGELKRMKSGLMDDLLTGRVRVTPLLSPCARLTTELR